MIDYITGGIIGIFLFAGLKEIADAIRDPKPKEKISRNAIGMVKKSQIITTKDNIEEILKK